jgi:hypothetical protein
MAFNQQGQAGYKFSLGSNVSLLIHKIVASTALKADVDTTIINNYPVGLRLPEARI